jgi:hypothetical protein
VAAGQNDDDARRITLISEFPASEQTGLSGHLGLRWLGPGPLQERPRGPRGQRRAESLPVGVVCADCFAREQYELLASQHNTSVKWCCYGAVEIRMRLFCALMAFLCVFATMSVAAHDALEISIEDRVECEQKIQEVYWRHRTHDQADEQRGFVFDREAARTRVLEMLRRATLLGVQWHQPLTAASISAELKRVERDSRDRKLLHELYVSLRSDPVLVGECLLRPMLAERLSRDWYYSDRAIHEELRKRALDQYQALSAADQETVALGDVRHFRESASTLYDLRTLFGDAIGSESTVMSALRHLQGRASPLREKVGSFDGWRVSIQSGAPVLEHWMWPKRSFESWWQDVMPTMTVDFGVLAPALDLKSGRSSFNDECLIGEWATTRNEEAFYPRSAADSVAVWTGAEMLVYGNPIPPAAGVPSSQGGMRYDPATDSWRSFSRPAMPLADYYHEGVWSGSELILWGGCRAEPGTTYAICDVTAGARYNPTTDTWRSMSQSGAPSVGVTRALQWIGNRMFAWGGSTGSNAAALYDPVADHWTSIATPPESRRYHKSLWTGSEVLVLGGVNGAFPASTALAYRPATNTWRTLPAADGPSWDEGYYDSTMMAWNGTEALVLSPVSPTAMRLFRYDAAHDTWSTAAATGTPSIRRNGAIAWVGGRLMIWGGISGINGDWLANGAMYLPASDSWLPIAAAGAPAARGYVFGIGAGSSALVWGGLCSDESCAGGARLNVVANSWAPMSIPANGPPTARTDIAAASDGVAGYIWGGPNLQPGLGGDGAAYSPVLDNWTRLPGTNAPLDRTRAYTAWTGERFLIFGGNGASGTLDDGGAYDPVTRTWFTVTAPPWSAPRNSYAVAAASGKLVVWGGHDGSDFIGTGYVHDLDSHEWTPMATTGAPAARFMPLATAHAGRIFVWGGASASSAEENGGIYDPQTNQWAPFPQSGAIPHDEAGSYFSSAADQLVDAGDHLLLWRWTENRGWRYNTATGVWQEMMIEDGGPPEDPSYNAHAPTIVWSGREALFWGGNYRYLPDNSWPSGGYGYSPAMDHWHPLEALNSPGGRLGQAGLAVGRQMMIWGGMANDPTWGQTVSSSGGLYCMDTRTGPLAADLEITAIFEQPVVSLSAPAVLVLRVRNNGPETATQIRLTTDTNVEFAFYDIDAGVGSYCTTPDTGGSGSISCALGAITAGAVRTARITVSAFASGAYTLQGVVVGGEVDGNVGNNTSTAVLDVVGIGDAIFSNGFD